MKRVLALLVVAMMLVATVPIAFADEIVRDGDGYWIGSEWVPYTPDPQPTEPIVIIEDEDDDDDDEEEENNTETPANPATGEEEVNEELEEALTDEEQPEDQVFEEAEESEEVAADTSVDEESDTATTEIDDSSIEEAVSKLTESSGTGTKAVAVSEAPSTSAGTSAVALSANAVSAIAGAEAGLEMSTSNGAASFPSDALASILQQADGEAVSIKMSLAESGKVEAKEGDNVLEFAGKTLVISVETPKGKISEFGDAQVSLSIPVSAEEGYKEGQNIKIAHINSKGQKEDLIGTVVMVNGQLVIQFKTKSFSSFVVMGVMDDAETVSPMNVSAVTESAASVNYGMIASAALGVAAIAVFVLTQKKRV